MLQPWLGLVGSLGRPRYKVETVNCTEKNFRVRHNGHGGKGSRLVCGTHIGNWWMASVASHPLWLDYLRYVAENVGTIGIKF